MKIILVRHGDADADIPEGLEDDARALTSRSRLALPAHFTALAPRIGPANLIYMSPLVRAVQTATLRAQSMVCGGPLGRIDNCYYSDDHYASFKRIVE